MFAIKQVMDVGDNFDGQLPGTTPEIVNGVKVYPKDTTGHHGGLFEFGMDTKPVDIYGFMFKGASQSTWTLSIVDQEVGDITWLTGTSATSYFLPPQDRITLLPGQKLKLVTTGTPVVLEMMATVMFAPAPIGET